MSRIPHVLSVVLRGHRPGSEAGSRESWGGSLAAPPLLTHLVVLLPLEGGVAALLELLEGGHSACVHV
jgi:hypothetical protein